MTMWVQQGIFVERVKDYCKKNGLLTARGAVKLDATADIFNLNNETLRQFLQNRSRKRPHINTLSHIANVVGCSVTEFLDAPSDPPPGISNERWAELSERERVIATEVLMDMTAEELTMQEKEELFGAYKDLKARMLRLRK
jgi:transcriptional regulator with XRE-family HTH domain